MFFLRSGHDPLFSEKLVSDHIDLKFQTSVQKEHCAQEDKNHQYALMGDCPNDVRESDISPDATFLKRALDAKLETGKTQNFTTRVGTANSITWWISISSSQVHEKCMKTEFSPELERVWFRSFRVCSACIQVTYMYRWRRVISLSPTVHCRENHEQRWLDYATTT